jgi:hypothetical protein
MQAVAAPRIAHGNRRDGVFDLATAQRLKHALEEEFSAAVPSISVLESAGEFLPGNDFAQSLREIPLRQLDHVMAARDAGLLGQAMRGRSLNVSPSRISAQVGERPAPRLSVGYRPADNDAFALEVRLQYADVQSVLYAKSLAKKRIGGEVPIGVLSKVAAHGGGGVHPAALNNNPLTLGSSVAHVSGGPGTLGLFVQAGKKPGFLSCSHVLANGGTARKGDAIHHPATADDGMHHAKIGSLRQFVDLRGAGPYAMDAAVAELAGTVRSDGNKIPKGQGWPSEGRKLAAPLAGSVSRSKAVVAKIGRSTGHTTGSVSLENVGPFDIYIAGLGNVTVTAMTEVRWDDLNKPFSVTGDSGSVAYLSDSLAPVGLVIGGGILEVGRKKTGVSYLCPLAPILKAWGLAPS